MNIKTAIDRTKVKLMTLPNSVFISTVLFSLNLRVTKQVPTAGTDGLELLVNEEYFLQLTPDERVGLLFHETFHVVFNHMARGKDLEQKRYNIAGDHVINNLAVSNGFTIPKGGYCNTKYQDWSTKAVYDDLPPDECSDVGGGIGADIIYNDGISDKEAEQREVNLTNTLLRAATRSKLEGDSPGTIPGEIEVMLDELLNPKLPWNVILQNYMSAYAKEDFTWARPNRRYQPEFYLPSAHSEAVGHIAVAVDTSGSVSDKEFSAFRDEIAGIQEMLKPEKISVLSFDTRIKNIDELGAEDSIANIKFHGRGGTDITDTWEWTKKNKPIVIIIFSDMYFDHPSEPSGTDVIWIAVNTNVKQMPHGITIPLQVKG